MNFKLVEKKALEFFKEFKVSWEKEIPSAVKCLDNSLDACPTYLQYPEEEWICLRTINVIERANKEFRAQNEDNGNPGPEFVGITRSWRSFV